MKLTQARLRELVDYDAATGAFTRKVACGRWSRIPAGSNAEHQAGRGYRCVHIEGTDHPCHRLAWLYVYGQWPSGVIDHINGDPGDNRISNLRDVDQSANMRNIKRATRRSKSGVLGVRVLGNCYQALVTFRRKVIYVGSFRSAEEAHNAYLAAKAALPGGLSVETAKEFT
jgi:hypothetical protein